LTTVYIETSIVSYLRQRPSSQIIAAARQVLTHRWWDHESNNYELVISQYILDEAAEGDPELSLERLNALNGIPLLKLDPKIANIATEIMSRSVLPEKAQVDALHIAVASYHKIDYLLTWNCKHIANAKILPRIHKVLSDLDCKIPMICTPEEMLGDDSNIE
jgi:hypothetical protein